MVYSEYERFALLFSSSMLMRSTKLQCINNVVDACNENEEFGVIFYSTI